MARRKRKPAPRKLSTYELMDWVCPVYLEMKEGSTDQTGVIAEVRGLLDGRYIWNVVYTRERFPDGRRADWQLGVVAMNRLNIPLEPCGSFTEALALARDLMNATALPVWRA